MNSETRDSLLTTLARVVNAKWCRAIIPSPPEVTTCSSTYIWNLTG